MRQEVVLEVVNHRNGLVEKLWCLAAIHEDGLSTKHLRYLSQYAGAALSYEPVAKLTHQWVCRNAREAVRAATLQANAQLRYTDVLALVLSSLLIEVAQHLHASLHLVALYTLGHQQLDA